MKTYCFFNLPIVVAFPVILFLFQNCSVANFSKLKDESTPKDTNSISSEAELTEETFTITTEVISKKIPMDVVWITDNSTSMEKESTYVRKNILAFANSFSENLDTNMILIGRRGDSGTSVNIPEGDSRFTQIDIKISSTDSLILLNKLWNNEHEKSAEFNAAWRRDVAKTLIFVTDDNSVISDSEFKKKIPANIANDIKAIHSVVGISSKESPCMANVGKAYINLSQQIKGEVFNICDEDWNGIFNKLVEKIEFTHLSLSNSVFEVSKNKITEIKSVMVNDKKIDPQAFSFAENRIEILDELFLGEKKTTFDIRVLYR